MTLEEATKEMTVDELIKRLRDCTAEQNGEKTLWCQAADAIEELQKRVPKTPHGRLIDADALYGTIEASKDGTIGHTTFKDTVLLNIRGMPTIIEAEEGE